MLIDCDDCAARGPACADCVVTALVGSAPEGVELSPFELDDVERAAVAVLAAQGMVPPLRLVPPATATG